MLQFRLRYTAKYSWYTAYTAYRYTAKVYSEVFEVLTFLRSIDGGIQSNKTPFHEKNPTIANSHRYLPIDLL